MSNDLVKAAAANVIDAMPIADTTAGAPLKPMKRMGVPGFVIINGQVQNNEQDGRLTGREKAKTFSQNLVNVAILGTGVRYFLDLIGGASWNFAPADDSPAAQETADFLAYCLTEEMETPWPRVVRRAGMYKFWGYSLQEWTMKPIEDGPWKGRIGFHDIEPRPQSTIERWDIDERGSVRGVIQRNPGNGQEIYLPASKLLRMTDDSLSDSPEGLGLFRHLVRLSSQILMLEDLEALGFKTDLQGTPIARAPLAELENAVEAGDLDKAGAAAKRFVLENFIRNYWKNANSNETMGLFLDSKTYETTDGGKKPSNQKLWDMELLKGGGSSHAAINEAIKRKTFELARLLGVEHLLFGADGGGSLALAAQGTKRLHGMVNSCLNEVTDSSNRQIIRPWAMANNIPRQLWPKIKPEEVAYRTVEEVMSVLTGLSTAGATMPPDDPAINAVRDFVGLPRQEIEHQIAAGLIAMGAGAPDDDEEDDEDEEDGGKPKPKGKGGRTAAKPSSSGNGGGKDPSALLDELRGYIAQQRAGANA